jgi:hypothetical protein
MSASYLSAVDPEFPGSRTLALATGADERFTRIPFRWNELHETGEIDFEMWALMAKIASLANFKTGALHFRSYEGLRELIGWNHRAEQLRIRALPALVERGEIAVETHQGRAGGVVRILHRDWFGKPSERSTSDALRTNAERGDPVLFEVTAARTKSDDSQAQAQSEIASEADATRSKSLDVDVEVELSLDTETARKRSFGRDANSNEEQVTDAIRDLVDHVHGSELTFKNWRRDFGHLPREVFWYAEDQFDKMKSKDAVKGDHAAYVCGILNSICAYDDDEHPYGGPNPSIAQIVEDYTVGGVEDYMFGDDDIPF